MVEIFHQDPTSIGVPMQNLIKKTGVFIVIAASALAVTACGSSPDPAAASTSTVTTTVTETETSTKTAGSTTESTDSSESKRSTSSSETSSSAPRPADEVVSHDNNWLFCDDGHSAAFKATTSCAFAKEVRKEFEKDPRETVVAKSPVTKQTYEMECSSMGDTTVIWAEHEFEAARCEGGNNAVVYIY